MNKYYLTLFAALFAFLSYGQHSKHSGTVYPFIREASPSKVNYPDKAHLQNLRSTAVWYEDFANGFNSSNGTWAAGGPDGAIWKHSYYGSKGCFSSNAASPAFTSAGNGFMLFDVDSVNCLDSTSNPPVYTQIAKEGYLVSPSINLSTENTCIVSIEHYYRFCCSGYEVFLGVSTDSANWIEFDITNHPFTAGSAVTMSANPQISEVNITNIAAGQPNVYLRLRWANMPFYFWAIDDINICPAPDHEVSIVEACWESTVDMIPYTMLPYSQAQNFKSYAKLANEGANAESVTFETDISGVVGFSSGGVNSPNSINLQDVAYDSTGLWNSGLTVGSSGQTYSFDYSNILLDHDPINNSIVFPFDVTDHTLGRDFNEHDNTGLWNGEDGTGNTNSFVFGLEYGVRNNAILYGLEIAVTNNTDPGVFVYPEVYEIDSVSGGFNLIYTGLGTSDEKTILASDISMGPNLTTLLLPINGGGQAGGVTLNGGAQYLFGVGHYGGPDALVLMKGGGRATAGCKYHTCDNSPATNYFHRQTSYIYDPNTVTGGPWFYLNEIPLIRGKLDVIDNIQENKNGIGLEQNIPNPFNGSSRINFSLVNRANVTFEITDVTGKIVKSINKGNLSVGTHVIELDANEFSGGIYNYTIKADGHTATKRMIITK